MNPLIKDIRDNPLLWLLVLVRGAFIVARLKPEAQTLLFVLSVLAIVPLTVSRDRIHHHQDGTIVGGLLNATLGTLADHRSVSALRAGQYMLVKASIAGPIVTNTLFYPGGVVLVRRPQASHAGIQPDERPRAGGAALCLVS